MKESTKFLTNKWIYNFTVFAILQYIVLSVVAMFIYPGSTHRNMDSQSYIFTENFLSDLGRYEVYNGTDNYISAGIYFWILLVVASATILFFTTIKDNFTHKLWLRILGQSMSITGVLAGMGLLCVAIVPANTFYNIHLFGVYVAFPLLLFTLLLLMIGIYANPKYPNKYAWAVLCTNFFLATYVGLLVYGPSPETSDEGLVIQVTGQKIIVYLLLIVMAIQAWGAKRLERKIKP